MLKLPPREQPQHCIALAAVVHRVSGQHGPATITRLWYDGCEMVSDEHFGPGEQVDIEIGGMGKIRSRVARSAEGRITVRFVEQCPV
jgi:hypothetical protein